ncbi:hypothetical protein V1525DRAFT_388613 [Lipomyces kononenkoae]|uniref:Uncharacterized protein n=1 Tax=Lipomyces kononenkoae TaxID=34357 RepID=A0ACC3T092_LIPKO
MVQSQKQKRKLSDDGGANKKQLRLASLPHQTSRMHQGQISHLQYFPCPLQQCVVGDSPANAAKQSVIDLPLLDTSVCHPTEAATVWYSCRDQRHDFARSIQRCQLPPSSGIIEDYEIQSADTRLPISPSDAQSEANTFPDMQNDDVDLSDDTADSAKASLDVEQPQVQSLNELPQKRRKLVYSMGYRADCEKCRAKIRGHYSHIVYLEEK